MRTRLLVTLIVVVSLLSAGVTPVAASSHTGSDQIESILSDDEALTESVNAYNSLIPEYRDQVPDVVESQLANTTANVHISGQQDYNYSARVADNLTLSEFDTSHRDDATLLITTDVETLNKTVQSDQPGQTARQQWEDDNIRVETTANSTASDRAVVTGTDVVKTISEESDKAIDQARKAVDRVFEIADQLGTELLN